MTTDHHPGRQVLRLALALAFALSLTVAARLEPAPTPGTLVAVGSGGDSPGTIDGNGIVTTGGETIDGLSEVASSTVGILQPSTDPQYRGQIALDRIRYRWEDRLDDWTIAFLPERAELYGLTLVDEKRIEIYVRPGQSDDLLAHVVAHEIGHAIDVTHNDGPARRLWQEARGIGSSPWWPGDGANDFSTGAGDFAESFAAWQVNADEFRGKLAGPPTPDQIDLLARLAG